MQAGELSRILEENGFSKLKYGMGWSKMDVVVQLTYGIVIICYKGSVVSFMLEDVEAVYKPESNILTIFEKKGACLSVLA